MKVNTMKQDWKKIQKQIEDRGESKIDVMIAKCFFRAGWEVYPEARHRFQITRNYEDSHHIEGISKDEAKDLIIELLRGSYSETEN